MAIKRKFANINVLEAAKIRIKNVFANGLPVYMAFSGGKDSLCLADVTMRLIQSGEIDASLLVVQFIDEEAIYKLSLIHISLLKMEALRWVAAR